MRNKKSIFLSLLLFYTVSVFCQAPSVSASEFNKLAGCWEGQLTYLDYGTNKPFSMPANLQVTRISNTKSFVLANIYPEEPKANANDTIIISGDGSYINKEKITSKQIDKDGTVRLTTELSGEDGNDQKQALFRFSYLLSPTGFTFRKEVQFTGNKEWILRHEYIYKTVHCK